MLLILVVVSGASMIVSMAHPKAEDENPNRSPREVIVLSATMQKITAKDNKIEKLIGRLDAAMSYHPDIICLPEVFANDLSSPEEVPGPITNRFTSYAKENNCYIICTLIRKEGQKNFNTAVLINRQGEIIGMYDKIHPTKGECDQGCFPSLKKDPPIFETDLGKIGILICFDINWYEEWKKLKEKGAEIVFWPSVYVGGRMLSSYARLLNYYVVGCSKTGPSIIYDTAGDMIATSGKYEKWALARLNLEKIHCEIDFHVKKVKQIRKKYGRKVKVKYYHNEDWVTIESKSPDLTIKKLVNEFALVSRWDYIKRAEQYQSKF